MLLTVILLFVAVPPSLANECQTALVQILPVSSFSATSSYGDMKASNLRFTSKDPWCPATNDEKKENVTVDLGCPRSVCKVEGNDELMMYYSGEYSNDKKNWTKLASDDKTTYDDESKMFEANKKAVITPPVRARYFRFRLDAYAYPEHGQRAPCLKLELYGEQAEEPEDSAVEPMGCFIEQIKRRCAPLLSVVYHKIKGPFNKKHPDILAIYEECRRKADEYSKPIVIFGITRYRQCVTTTTGTEEEYFQKAKKFVPRMCRVCNGKGIGTKSTAAFVYKRNV